MQENAESLTKYRKQEGDTNVRERKSSQQNEYEIVLLDELVPQDETPD